MQKFFFSLWLYWAFLLTLLSIVWGLLLSGCVTVGVYLYKGAPEPDSEITAALYDIGVFWFGILWSAALPVTLLAVTKRLFNRCFYGFRMVLYSCDGSEQLDEVRLEDCLKLWRKWLFVIIWAVAAQVLVAAAAVSLLGSGGALLSWFNIYWLYLFVLLAGGITLRAMASRCKRVKVAPC